MKKKILKYIISKLYKSRITKSRYFWLRFWIEKLQDPEESYALIDKFAKSVNLIKDAHIQYQLSNIVNDYFVCDDMLYIITNLQNIYAFEEDLKSVCKLYFIQVTLISDRWTGQKEMHEHLIINSLV